MSRDILNSCFKYDLHVIGDKNFRTGSICHGEICTLGVVSEVRIATVDIFRHHVPGLLTIVDEKGNVTMGVNIFGVSESVENDTNANEVLLGAVQIAGVVKRLLGDPKSNSITKEILSLA